jgi:hypothetical protein
LGADTWFKKAHTGLEVGAGVAAAGVGAGAGVAAKEALSDALRPDELLADPHRVAA